MPQHAAPCAPRAHAGIALPSVKSWCVVLQNGHCPDRPWGCCSSHRVRWHQLCPDIAQTPWDSTKRRVISKVPQMELSKRAWFWCPCPKLKKSKEERGMEWERTGRKGMKIFTFPVIAKQTFSETIKKAFKHYILEDFVPYVYFMILWILTTIYVFYSTSILMFISGVTYGRSAVILLPGCWPIWD